MQTYLDLDELLDSVNDEHMFVPTRRLSDDSFVTSVHVAILEGLFVGFVIVQITQNDRRRFDKQFTRLVVSGHFVSLGSDNLALNAWKYGAARAEPNVVRRR